MANVNITVNLNVTPLTDNSTWFLNAASWNSYWSGQGFTTTIPQASTSAFGVVQTAASVAFNPPSLSVPNQVTFNIDGVQYSFVDAPSFDSLYSAFVALQADYTTLKTALKNAGLISNA